MRRSSRLPLVVALLAAPSSVLAQAIDIDHKPVGCIVAGKYPKLSACFSPAGKLARSRVYFRPEAGGANWYYVEMKNDQPCFAGILPKPKKALIGQRVLYYIDAFDQQFAENRTPDQAAEVVRSERECKKDIPIAPIVTNASVTVFPSLPAGFAAAGLSSGAVAGIVVGGAAVVGGGAAIASSGGSGDTTTTTTSPSGPGVPQQTTTTTTSTTTTTTTLAAAKTPFEPSFRINPSPATGNDSVRVEFNMCLSRGEDLKYAYDFDGDGVEDFRGACRMSRVYDLTGVSASVFAPPSTFVDPCVQVVKKYESVMTVFEPSGSARPPVNIASQTNLVTVNGPPPPPFCSDRLAQAPPHTGDAASGSSRGVDLASQLDVAGGSGQVVVNGTSLAFAGRGRSALAARGRRGENRVEAQLVQAAGGGQWRFEVHGEGLEAGSLRVVAGEVTLVSSDAVVFRMSGKPGERVVFTFRSN